MVRGTGGSRGSNQYRRRGSPAIPLSRAALTNAGEDIVVESGGVSLNGQWQLDVERYLRKRLRQHARRAGMRRDDYAAFLEERLAAALTGTTVCVRVWMSAVETVVTEGSLKNLHQTGRSHGGNVPADRAQVEQSLFGLALNVPGEQRPVYGYLTRDTSLSLPSGHPLLRYGAAVIELGAHVKDRVTFTVGDSTNQLFALLEHADDAPQPTIAASRLGAPHWTSACFGFSFETRIRTVKPEDPGPDFTDAPWYVEAQIHGGVTTADIAAVRFDPGYEPDGDTKNILDEKGIVWHRD